MSFSTIEGVTCFQDRMEFDRLLEIMRETKVSSILEIGTCYGGSTLEFWKKHLETDPDGFIVTIDPNPAQRSVELTKLSDTFPDKVMIMEEDSAIAFTHLPRQKYDMVFIDGDHLKAERDFALYWDKAEKLIVFDDINYPPVKHDWEICKKYRRAEEIHNPKNHVDSGRAETQWQGLGVIRL